MVNDAVSHASPQSPLEANLQTIARRTRQTMREERVIGSAFASLDAALFLTGLPALLEIGSAIFFGVSLFSATALITLSLLLGAAWILLRAARRATAPIGDAVAIAEIDRALHLEDRLIAAREFSALPSQTPFMQAAIADATEAVQDALESGLPRTPLPTVGSTPGLRGFAVLLLLILALSIELPPAATESFLPADGGGTEVALADRTADREESSERPAVVLPPPAPPPAKSLDQKPSGTEPGGERSGEVSDDVKKTLGKTTSGKSSSAASSSGASQSKGAPSNQSQASEAQQEKSRRTQKKPKEAKQQEEATTPPKVPEESSGATAGRGAASGSSKSPSASKWSSKDQVTSEDEEDLEEDEEVDDEFDNSDARGGMQPQLRDRKPPVNRDLTIGFGNGKNPDANGRGGQSERKKSRGVASLVLGVPIPDHVKGRPNPGKTKITQERVEPQQEEAQEIAAAARAPRQSGIGRVARPDLVPWMRDLLQSYYRVLRTDDGPVEKDEESE